jgi:uncharacterized protein YodC (DUF2158 family)
MAEYVLAPGDIVRLKSGGPNMMVDVIVGDHAICTWHQPVGPQPADTAPNRPLIRTTTRRVRDRFVIATLDKIV